VLTYKKHRLLYSRTLAVFGICYSILASPLPGRNFRFALTMARGINFQSQLVIYNYM